MGSISKVYYTKEITPEAASAVVDHFQDKIVYVNVMANMSVDCD